MSFLQFIDFKTIADAIAVLSLRQRLCEFRFVLCFVDQSRRELSRLGFKKCRQYATHTYLAFCVGLFSFLTPKIKTDECSLCWNSLEKKKKQEAGLKTFDMKQELFLIGYCCQEGDLKLKYEIQVLCGP